jgi:hypothetical protein
MKNTGSEIIVSAPAIICYFIHKKALLCSFIKFFIRNHVTFNNSSYICARYDSAERRIGQMEFKILLLSK